jgi:hypothetical protein
MRNQQAIQESLIIEAGAEAEAAAIIEETNSRAPSPNLGLENLSTNEKIGFWELQIQKNLVKKTTSTQWSSILVRLIMFARSRH